MKKIILSMVAVFLMSGMVMAQHARRGDKMPDPKVRAERMTERMVKEYALNDTQKQQLMEVNLAMLEKMGGQKRQMTDEQRAQMKAEMEKKREEMQAARTAYNEQLQKILTKEQYTAYTQNMQDKQGKKESGRRKAPRK